jgi:nucleotide-binding universal stress UspA family protein
MSLHVLIATDGSDASIDAARRGRDLLAGIERITLLTVVSDDDPGDDAGGIEGPVLTESEQDEIRQQQASEARDELARTAAMLTGAPVQQLIDEGDPADTICRVADRLGVDAIVVGSHGRTGLRRLFLGSVSEHVVRHAPCPVLVVRSPASSD